LLLKIIASLRVSPLRHGGKTRRESEIARAELNNEKARVSRTLAMECGLARVLVLGDTRLKLLTGSKRMG
jgi:hypothetical protein